MPAFPLTIGQAYYRQGFFNVPVDFGRFVGRHGEPVTLVLGTAGEAVETHINRTANQNGSPRIMPKAKLRDWFQDNFKVGDIVEVRINSPRMIHIGSRPPRTATPTDLERAYSILYLRLGASLTVAEAAYKAAMKTAHPDVGGTNEAARELTWAIEKIRRYATS